MSSAPSPAKIFSIERPHPKLMRYYALRSLAAGPFFPLVLIPSWFRYHTLRYRFDDEGVSMAWGVLFRREIHLTYARIQDLHLVSNIVERWLGLARLEVQTASGSSKAEMTLEGLTEHEELRDFFYSRMRGHALGRPAPAAAAVPASADADPALGEDVAAVLREVARELRAVRQALDRSAGGRSTDV